MAKDYPNCYHTVLRPDLQYLYVFEVVAAIVSHRSQDIQENIKHLRHHYKKSKNLRQITGKRQVHLCLYKAY